jgi:hypothetical protein
LLIDLSLIVACSCARATHADETVHTQKKSIFLVCVFVLGSNNAKRWFLAPPEVDTPLVVLPSWPSVDLDVRAVGRAFACQLCKRRRWVVVVPDFVQERARTLDIE